MYYVADQIRKREGFLKKERKEIILMGTTRKRVLLSAYFKTAVEMLVQLQ